MKIGITGLSNSGKTTVFNALTGQHIETTIYANTTGEPNMGMVKVPDTRLDRLSAMFKPKKTTYSTVQYIDFIGLTKGDMKQNKLVFGFIKDTDAIVHVVRAFRDDAVAHPLDKVDPMADIATVETELIFGDMELVERRIEGIETSKKKGKKPATDHEEKALVKCREALESERALRDVEFTAEEQKALRHLQFMSVKPMIIAINIHEDDLGSEATAALVREAGEYFSSRGSRATVLAMSGKVEMEIAELDAAEAAAFLEDLGIEEPALNRLIRLSYASVGLISFFTAGEDECRAWTIRKGDSALEAAGKIHSDIQRGFIRAETVSYDDFIAAGTFSANRDNGTMRLEGKTYTVADGDIINFRFNV